MKSLYPQRLLSILSVISVVLLFSPVTAKAQQRILATKAAKVYLNAYNSSTNAEEPSQATTYASVARPEAALDNVGASANLEVTSTDPYYGKAALQLTYNTDVPAQTTTFIKINQFKPFNSVKMTNTDLGLLLGTLLNAEAYTENGTEDGALISAADVKVEATVNGTEFFLAITPNSSYRHVRVWLKYIDQINGQSTGGKISMNVHYAFYVGASTEDCGIIWAASVGEVVSGTVPLSTAVKSPGAVADNDETTFSTVQTGGKSNVVAQQTLFFSSTPTDVTEKIKLNISIPKVALRDDIFDKIKFQPYLGTTVSGPAVTLRTLTGSDRLTVFDNEVVNSIYLNPGVNYDRYIVTVESTSTLYTAIYLISGGRLVASPTLESTAITGCPSQTFSLKVANVIPEVQYSWYDSTQTLLKSGVSQYDISGLAAGKYTFYVAAAKPNCSATISALIKAEITVLPIPGPPDITLQAN